MTCQKKSVEHIETERKFLIRYPDITMLQSLENVIVKEITQTYLKSDPSITLRVRKLVTDGVVKYFKTTKKRINALSCYEDENDITKEEYEKELNNADHTLRTIEKKRFCFPFADHIIEIDVYPFWNDRAILEVELKSEHESFVLPEFVSVIKDVTSDKRYKNVNLARSTVKEDIC